MLHAAGEWGLSGGDTSVQAGDLGLEVKNEAKRHGAHTAAAAALRTRLPFHALGAATAIAAMFPKVVKPVDLRQNARMKSNTATKFIMTSAAIAMPDAQVEKLIQQFRK